MSGRKISIDGMVFMIFWMVARYTTVKTHDCKKPRPIPGYILNTLVRLLPLATAVITGIVLVNEIDRAAFFKMPIGLKNKRSPVEMTIP